MRKLVAALFPEWKPDSTDPQPGLRERLREAGPPALGFAAAATLLAVAGLALWAAVSGLRWLWEHPLF